MRLVDETAFRFAVCLDATLLEAERQEALRGTRRVPVDSTVAVAVARSQDDSLHQWQRTLSSACWFQNQ
jgi:hypothetical protein